MLLTASGHSAVPFGLWVMSDGTHVCIVCSRDPPRHPMTLVEVIFVFFPPTNMVPGTPISFAMLQMLAPKHHVIR